MVSVLREREGDFGRDLEDARRDDEAADFPRAGLLVGPEHDGSRTHAAIAAGSRRGIVAWRVLLLCRLGRTCLDLNCEVAFEPFEWKAVSHVVIKKPPPRLNDLLRLIATLGGDVNRAKTESGTQTLWIGLQRLHDFAQCYDSFGPASQKC